MPVQSQASGRQKVLQREPGFIRSSPSFCTSQSLLSVRSQSHLRAGGVLSVLLQLAT